VQYAENRVTRQSTQEAFRATGASPLPFIPEGRTDSPPEGLWSPLAGPCALRGGFSLSAESDRLCCHLPESHPTLRLAVLPPAAHLRHDATRHWQLAGTTGGWATTKEVNDDGNLSHAGEGRKPR